jgi:hypothetical protein
MTKDEALKLALEALTWANKEINKWRDDAYGYEPEDYPEIMSAIAAIKEALAQAAPVQEPIKIDHKHEWFRTGEMEVGQARCISCGAWAQEEMPQRTWVGLNAEDRLCAKYMQDAPDGIEAVIDYIEAKLKELNHG